MSVKQIISVGIYDMAVKYERSSWWDTTHELNTYMSWRNICDQYLSTNKFFFKQNIVIPTIVIKCTGMSSQTFNRKGSNFCCFKVGPIHSFSEKLAFEHLMPISENADRVLVASEQNDAGRMMQRQLGPS